jgi:rfaE bifunctional protein kinase chain/domain
MNIDEILATIPSLRILVVGDVCLDRRCTYEPRFGERSRETGLARVAVTSVECSPGAAGTVASNLAAMGVERVAVLGVAGGDGHGFELRRSLQARRIDESKLLTIPERLTFTYTKLINRATGQEDLPRLDFVHAEDLPAPVEAEMLARFEEMAAEFDAIVVSDQMELTSGGVVTAAVRAKLASFGAAHPEKVIWVDSRTRGELFRGVLLKLNEQEALAACRNIGAAGDFDALRRHVGHSTLIVTRGIQGAIVFTDDGASLVPARRIEKPADICGAGDSFTAGAIAVMRLTGDPLAASRFGNLIASITIRKPGTGTASPAEIRREARDQGCFQ